MPSRDNFLATTKNQLAQRVGYRCSNPNCRKITAGPTAEEEGAVNIGVAAHITAAAPGGPRYSKTLTSEERSSLENGIWLCQTCAKLIDSNPEKYSIENLRQWKNYSEKIAEIALETRTDPFDGSEGVYMEAFKTDGTFNKKLSYNRRQRQNGINKRVACSSK